MLLRLITYLALVQSAAALSCNLNSTEPVVANVSSVHDSTEPRQVLLSNNVQSAAPGTPGLLQMHSANNFALLAQLNQWPTPSEQVATINAEPFVIDTNHDGIADAVYVVDINGQLWFIPLNATSFGEPEWVADLSVTEAVFDQPLQMVQTLSPDHNGILRKVSMLLVIGKKADGDILLALKHSKGSAEPVMLSQLTDRTAITADEVRYGISESLWTQIQQGNGWFVNLQQRITAVPQVYAGVVYVTAANGSAVQADCSLADEAASQLYAMHLHHAGLIYAQRHWDISSETSGSLALISNSEGELELSLQAEGQVQPLLSELLAITDECADCVSTLSADQYPQRIRLATFQTEQGAH
ncbi:hypothetical protein [Rheinheimera baltica]|uniref:hypothetical protein n=1 Tax=Rheinheimera baltica TaxID=67576 RepID=UPI00273E46FF|nr:hypothetical protein [Rheinheimera baltica]MDP5191144.1 hypothetical protein [Rheinheimera baltica]